METAGIIAEYNPFHRGHARQIRFLREMGIKQIVVVMSGDWVQRGAPAWADKYLRTKMALMEGADLVLELPVLYALSSGESFAFGGVSMVDALSLDCLCFGSECGDIEILSRVAEVLVNEPQEYRELLKEKLRQGVSYPTAREYALSCLMPEMLGVLKQPNNILGIEYLKAVKRLKSNITPVTLPRNDVGYHQKQISSDLPSSAAAIRATYGEQKRLDSCRDALPDKIYSLLQEHDGFFSIGPNDFSSLVYYSLRSKVQEKTLTHYGDISVSLANRIEKNLKHYERVMEFCQILKTKNITFSHIARSLFQVLLEIDSHLQQKNCCPVPYLRLLGMRQGAGSLLRNVSVPVITKVADYDKVLSNFYSHDRLSFARECFQRDLFAADIYRQAVFEKTGKKLLDEYRAGVVIQRNGGSCDS